jgi:hypothetical protein
MKKKNDNKKRATRIFTKEGKDRVVLHPHYHRQLSRRVARNWQHYLKQKENFSSVLNCVGCIDI